MGVLLPILYVLWDTLRALKAKPLKYPRPFLEYLLENPHSDKRPKGFKARFLSFFYQIDFLMDTAIHPLFKLPVVRLLSPEKVAAVKSKQVFEVTKQAVLDTSESSSPNEDEEDDSFMALRSSRPAATEDTNSTRFSNKLGKELESWCSEKQRSKLLEQAMFPALFLWRRTPHRLPAIRERMHAGVPVLPSGEDDRKASGLEIDHQGGECFGAPTSPCRRPHLRCHLLCGPSR
ncbi:hypothetical protein GWK47_025542 [Chionoecetes opilio]|uniref:Uncharacterized protein n=1 Tax=Chionoecetes opilio TaxID=41210 RepID=A0A8J8WN41_CHIOP|nr:hypothetical protein GWK47_025542 [Chionoecetes opilio]